MTKQHYQVAIDGPAASGKSTAARLLAARLGGYYVNTGDMYRAVAWAALKAGVDPVTQPEKVIELLPGWDLRYRVQPGQKQTLQLCLNGQVLQPEEFRMPEVTAVVSQVASIPALREWMLDRQRECDRLGIVIMEGRDIGTVIFPQARFKFFITASPEERARRRFAQRGEVAADATLAAVAAEIAARDHLDSTRAVAPLRSAPDALLVNTDGRTQDEVADWLATYIREQQ